LTITQNNNPKVIFKDTLKTPKRSNCLVWALATKHLLGGKLKWRPSHNYPGLHFYLEFSNGEAWGYSPDRAYWPIPWNIFWFRGHLKREY